MLPAERTEIELLETITPDAEVMSACRQLKSEGYALALDDFTNTSDMQPLLALADVVCRRCGSSRSPAWYAPRG